MFGTCFGGGLSDLQAAREGDTVPTTGVVRGTVKRAHSESSSLALGI